MQSFNVPTAALPAGNALCPSLPDASGASAGSTEAFRDLMDQALGDAPDQISSEAAATETDSETPALEQPLDDTSATDEQSTISSASEYIVSLILSAPTQPQQTTTAAIEGEAETSVPQEAIAGDGTAGQNVSGTSTTPFTETSSTTASSNAAVLETAQQNAQGSATDSTQTTAKEVPSGTAANDDVAGNLHPDRLGSSNSASEMRTDAAAEKVAANLNAPITPDVSKAEQMPSSPSALDSSVEVVSETEAALASDQSAESESEETFAGQNLPATPNGEKAISDRKNAASRTSSVLGEVAGTSSAKYASPMQKAEKVKQSAGSNEQNLPVNDSTAAVRPAPRPAFEPAQAARVDRTDARLDPQMSFQAVTSSTETQTASITLASITSARTLERTQDLIALHAFRLRDFGTESMQVIIKPDQNLHLSLNVQMRDGAVEVTANLQKGDFELLNRHWAELQQQLESRGIRLAPLSQSENHANNNSSQSSNNSFSQHSRREQSEEKPARTGAFAEFALTSVLVPKRTNKVTSPRGWESWA
jgi:hypothetical protein